MSLMKLLWLMFTEDVHNITSDPGPKNIGHRAQNYGGTYPHVQRTRICLNNLIDTFSNISDAK